MDDILEGRKLRLNELFNALNFKNITFAKTLKTNPGFVSQLLNGHRKLTTEFAYRISKCYPKVNAVWLISGDGNMFIEEKLEVKTPEPGLLTGVMEPAAGYERMRSLRVEELPEIILSLQAEVEELRERVKRLEEKLEGKGKGV